MGQQFSSNPQQQRQPLLFYTPEQFNELVSTNILPFALPPNSYLNSSNSNFSFKSQKLEQTIPNLGRVVACFLRDGTIVGFIDWRILSTERIPIRGVFKIDQEDNNDVTIRVETGFVRGGESAVDETHHQQQQQLYWNKYEGKLRPSYQQRLGNDEDEERTFKVEFLTEQEEQNAIKLFLPEKYHLPAVDEENQIDADSKEKIRKEQQQGEEKEQTTPEKQIQQHQHSLSNSNSNNNRILTPSQTAMIIALDAIVHELGGETDTNSMIGEKSRSLIIPTTMMVPYENNTETTPTNIISSSPKLPSELARLSARRKSSTGQETQQLINEQPDDDVSSTSSFDADDDDEEQFLLLEGEAADEEREKIRKRKLAQQQHKRERGKTAFTRQRAKKQLAQKKKLFWRMGGTYHIPSDEEGLRKVFETFDTDSSLFIDREEFIKCYLDFEADMGLECKRSDVEAIFKKIDRNCDARLSFAEFQIFLLNRAKY